MGNIGYLMCRRALLQRWLVPAHVTGASFGNSDLCGSDQSLLQQLRTGDVEHVAVG